MWMGGRIKAYHGIPPITPLVANYYYIIVYNKEFYAFVSWSKMKSTASMIEIDRELLYHLDIKSTFSI